MLSVAPSRPHPWLRQPATRHSDLATEGAEYTEYKTFKSVSSVSSVAIFSVPSVLRQLAPTGRRLSSSNRAAKGEHRWVDVCVLRPHYACWRFPFRRIRRAPTWRSMRIGSG